MVALPVPESLLSNVLSQYTLPNARVVGVHEASTRNDNLLVEDDNGQRYILRRYRRNNQEARVRFQLSFQQHLASSGFPTAEIIRSVSDDVLVIEGDTPWALFTFVEGTEYDFSRVGQVVEAARRLAQFHAIADSFRDEEVVLDISRMPDWWQDAAKEIDALEVFFAGMGVEDELACIREYVAELVDKWPVERNTALRSTWVHGDYHGRNMVFINDEMRGLFDFDVIRRGFRIEDISLALFMFGREQRGSRTIRHDIAQAFLREYRRNAELGPEELEALPVLAVLERIPVAPYYEMIKRGGENPIPFLRDHVETMRTMRSEMKRIEPIFRGRIV
jgi:Ser/Thr protein kinase RdoA (MazF antagonist)